MKRLQFLILILLLVGFIIFIKPTIVKANDTYTTSDGIIATKIVENTNGTIDFKLTNINLNEEGQYMWAIDTTSIASDVKKWFTLADFSESKKSAILSITPTNSSIKSILRTTNTAWLYVKDNANNNMIVDALKVDLTLPALKAFKIIEQKRTNTDFDVESIYDISNLFYKIEKIDDENVINAYKEAVDNGKDLSSISSLALLSQAPETGWSTVEGHLNVSNKYFFGKKPVEDGLYYVWVKGKDANTKTVIGYTLYYGDRQGPTVRTIEVVSPNSGSYKTGQTIRIRVYFTETITGTTIPNLKIKFGDSSERIVSNGTIKGTYIEYSYNIQDSDKGQLATVDIEGGTIKDAAGNDAILSCPIISGNTIKANTEVIITNNTDNQDVNKNNKEDNTTTNEVKDDLNKKDETKNDSKDNSDKGEVSVNEKKDELNYNNIVTINGSNNSETTNDDGEKNKSNSNVADSTSAKSSLPKTGLELKLGITIIVISGISGFIFMKCRKYQGI